MNRNMVKKEYGKMITPFKRKDGLVVFLDGNKKLDHIRKYGDKKSVIIAVALYRAQQIALNYARKYAPELISQGQISVQRRLKSC